MMTLKKMKDAQAREYADDHLSQAEREAFVMDFKQTYPDRELPEDVNEAFLEILDF